MRTCSKCGEEKSLSEFYKMGGERTGLRTTCKECDKKVKSARDKRNAVKLCEYARKYRSENREECAERSRKYRSENLEKYAEHSKKYRLNNPKKVSRRNKAWVAANRFKNALRKSKHEAKSGGHLPCSATSEELKAAFTGKCHACGMTEEEHGKRLCIDHDHETGTFRGHLCHVCNRKDVLAVA